MSKCLVRFCHAMSIFFFLNSTALFIGSWNQFGCQSFRYGLSWTAFSCIHYPEWCKVKTAILWYFNGYLVCSTAYTPGFDFHRWGSIFHCFLKYFQTDTKSKFMRRFWNSIQKRVTKYATNTLSMFLLRLEQSCYRFSRREKTVLFFPQC